MADFGFPNVEGKMAMKICFIINSMVRGGAERVMSVLLKNLSRRGREIFLIILEDRPKCRIPEYEIPQDVKAIKIFSSLSGDWKKLFAVFWGLFKLRKIIKENKFDLTVSFLERSNYINILARNSRFNHKVYINERINPSAFYQGRGLKSKINSFLIKKLYKKADLIIANSLGVKKSLVEDFSIDRDKIKVIYNPLDIEKIDFLSREPLEPEYQKIFSRPVIINVGSLNEKKGQHHLIRAFAKVCGGRASANFKLVILGQGELEEKLKKLVRDLGLEKDVFFLGWQKNPFKFVSRAKVFVLSSLTEGFPNVLTEAMACGTPVVSFDCPSGPNEIIKQGESGLLVSAANEESLARAIIEVLDNPCLAEKLSRQGRQRAQYFSVKNLINKYEEIFK